MHPSWKRKSNVTRSADSLPLPLVRQCTGCIFFNEYHEDRLMPDKTVQPRRLRFMWCDKGKFELEDIKACELFQNGRADPFHWSFDGKAAWENRRLEDARWQLALSESKLKKTGKVRLK